MNCLGLFIFLPCCTVLVFPCSPIVLLFLAWVGFVEGFSFSPFFYFKPPFAEPFLFLQSSALESMAKTKTTATPPPPRSNCKEEYRWASDELLAECSTLTSVEDVEAHRGDPTLYNFKAFHKTHDSHIFVCRVRPGEPVCVDERATGEALSSSSTKWCLNEWVCAFPLLLSKGSYSLRSTLPLPSFTPTAGRS